MVHFFRIAAQLSHVTVVVFGRKWGGGSCEDVCNDVPVPCLPVEIEPQLLYTFHDRKAAAETNRALRMSLGDRRLKEVME
jgi:hypothetical protein